MNSAYRYAKIYSTNTARRVLIVKMNMLCAQSLELHAKAQLNTVINNAHSTVTQSSRLMEKDSAQFGETHVMETLHLTVILIPNISKL